MGSLFRRSKLTLDALRKFRDFTCKIKHNNPIQNPIQTTRHSFQSSTPSAISNLNTHQRYPGVQFRKGYLSPFLSGGRRNYYVDRRQVTHFRPRGYRRWFNNPRTVFATILIGSGLAITVYLGNLETVPYTNRTHLVLLSHNLEKQLGESQFKQMKASFKGKILPAIHPESVRVRLIAKDIINALHRGLSKEKAWTDLGYSSDSPNLDKQNEHDALMSLNADNAVVSEWGKDDEVLDDKWVEKSREKGIQKQKKTTTEHLESFNWEILVVNEPVVNAFCLPGGKIVVFTGLLDRFKSDDEIATILGHEVAHALGRHAAEGITKNLWIVIVQLILYQFVMPDLANAMSVLFLRLPFSRKMEIEADYIGLLIMASAGYDPRVAPGVYKKLDEISGGSSKMNDYLSTHPSGKKRAMLLAQSKVMEEALLLYQERSSGRGIEGFL